jgi:polysaccharide export outer membrane protein
MFRDSFPGSSEVIWKRFSVLLLLPLVFAALAAGQGQNGAGAADAPAPSKTMPALNDLSVNGAGVDQSKYIIGPNDILYIEVFREKDWTKPYQVRTDGMITVALVGEMKAAGLTPKQLQDQLTEGLKDQAGVKDPLVTVSVYEVKSKQYEVAGQVKRPGPYPLIKDPTTVFEAINIAGGFLDNFSNQKKILILRGAQRLDFNYKDYVDGKHLDKNIPLENGDTVIVK